ncbi:MAG: heme biosynthesis HemY N-terminal domain-containing protein [Pseudomonadota bacterium]
MLWSVGKIIIFVCLAGAVTLGVAYLLNIDRAALVQVGGREYAIGPLSGIVLAVVIFLAVWLFIRLVGLVWACVKFLNGDETAISRYWNRRAERRGYQALSEGMMALAAGEGRLAIRKAQRAEGLLKRPELTNLIVARGAEMVGDASLANKTFREMVTDERTRFVGIRGLIDQKLADGDMETAQKLSERALALRPQNSDVQDTLLDLQLKDEDWAGARATLAAKLKSGHLPRDIHRRRDAVLSLAVAREEMAAGQVDKARQLAVEANKMSPSLVPAAVMAARLEASSGNKRAANKIIRKAWNATPHPDLAAAFAEIEKDESPQDRLKRFQPLIKKHAGQTEVRLLETELNIAAEDFPSARKALGDLPETAPDARSLTLMAAIERGEGGEDRVVRAWLAKAVTASRGPQWICDVDGQAYGEWQPVTKGGFDTLSWKSAPTADPMASDTAGVLPLIVGSIEDHSADPEIEDAEEMSAIDEDATSPEEPDAVAGGAR